MLKDNILLALIDNSGEFVSGESLARRFEVSRMAVSKAVSILSGEGNEIEAVKNRGYRLILAGDKLSKGRINSGLRTKFLGHPLEILQKTQSTNTALKERDLLKLPEGFTLISEEQTGGRGRFGRSFSSPSGAGIYMSILLKPCLPAEKTPFLTLLAALSVSRAVETVSGLRPGIKWVNDIYIGQKKLCGILTEGVFTAETGMVEGVICGIGINTGDISDDIRDIATSILLESGKRGVRNLLAAEILNELEEIYASFKSGETDTFIKEYRAKLILLGRPITVLRGNETFEATALDIDENGGLVIRPETGEIMTLQSGEVSLRL